LTSTAASGLHDTRTGQNTQHSLLALLRQSIDSRLAGYEDVNDAERLCLDPAMRTWSVVGPRIIRQLPPVRWHASRLRPLAPRRTSTPRTCPISCSSPLWTWSGLSLPTERVSGDWPLYSQSRDDAARTAGRAVNELAVRQWAGELDHRQGLRRSWVPRHGYGVTLAAESKTAAPLGRWRRRRSVAGQTATGPRRRRRPRRR
jgi:hypothetical protein